MRLKRYSVSNVHHMEYMGRSKCVWHSSCALATCAMTPTRMSHMVCTTDTVTNSTTITAINTLVFCLFIFLSCFVWRIKHGRVSDVYGFKFTARIGSWEFATTLTRVEFEFKEDLLLLFLLLLDWRADFHTVQTACTTAPPPCSVPNGNTWSVFVQDSMRGIRDPVRFVNLRHHACPHRRFDPQDESGE